MGEGGGPPTPKDITTLAVLAASSQRNNVDTKSLPEDD